MPMRRELDHDFFKKWNPEMAYVLGFFAADGSMIKNRRGGHFIEFTTTDRIILENVRRVVRSSHKLTRRDRGNEKWKLQYRLQFGSRSWFNDLSRIGFTQNKSKTLKFPEVPKPLLASFVRGYFDGDGCVYLSRLNSKLHSRTKKWVFSTLFTSGSVSFLDFLHSELKKYGVLGGYISKKNRGFELIFSRHDSVALYRFMYHTAKTPYLYLPRKREKFERAIQILDLMRE